MARAGAGAGGAWRGGRAPGAAARRAGALAAVLAWAGGPAQAQFSDVQGLLFAACAAPVPGSDLDARCGESAGGNVSTDSESSLSPNQFLSADATSLARGRARQREIHQLLEDRRDREADAPLPVARLPRRGPGSALALRPLGAPGEGGEPAPGRFGVLAGGRATWFDRAAGETERGYQGTTHSLQLGGDYRVAEGLFLGAAFTWDRTDSDYDPDRPTGAFPAPGSNSGTLDGDSFGGSLFGSWNLTPAIYLDASFGYGSSDLEIERDVVFQDSTRAVASAVRTRGKPDGSELSAGLGLGYELFRGGTSFGPYGRLGYVRARLDGYTESDLSGSGLHMLVEELVRESLTTAVGARLGYAIGTPVGVLVPQGRFEWEHEFLQRSRNQSTLFVLDTAANQLILTGDNPDRSHFNLGAGLLLVLPGGWQPFLDYEGLVGWKDLGRHRFTFGVRAEI